ncbi:MAG: hypothetical protein E7456_06745 [Ruminococcaceae bacterium]|nr:hypothetical protein [Oscillospiraceae bacterium]
MHREYERIIPESKTAVLLIHGIAGTPNHFRFLLPLIPSSMSVCNMLLEGHGKGVEDFSSASMEKWKNQVSEKLGELRKTHQRILIVAHSMGTLFAIKEAVQDPSKIEALFLLASPLRLFIKPSMPVTSLKVYLGKIKPTDHKALAAREAYGIRDDKRFWKYLGWIPRYLELFEEIRNTRRIFAELTVPTFAYQSKKDEMVSMSSCKVLCKSSCTQLHILKTSGHYYYSEKDMTFLTDEFSKLIGKYNTK